MNNVITLGKLICLLLSPCNGNHFSISGYSQVSLYFITRKLLQLIFIRNGDCQR